MAFHRRLTLTICSLLLVASLTNVRANVLTSGQSLPFPNGTLCSNSGCAYYLSYYYYYLDYLTLYYHNSNPYWFAVIDGAYSGHGYGQHRNQWANAGPTGYAVMQGDGNFVLYKASTGAAVWETNTDGHAGAFLNAQSDGNLVVYSASNSPLWSLF